MKTELLREMDRVQSALLAQLAAFTDETLNTVPFEASWTAGQVAAHLLKSETGMIALLRGQTQPAHRAPDQWVETLRKDFADYSIRMESPPFVWPEDIRYRGTTLWESILRSGAAIRKAALESDLTQICTDFAFPVFGTLSGEEILTFVICHTRRHLHQLEKIARALRQTTTRQVSK